jgi:hypothetical protein
VLLSGLTLFFQLLVLFACCAGLGLTFRFLIPNEFSVLSKVFCSFMGGFCLVVLIPQNLVYLGLPVRISAWLVLGATLAQVWWCRRKLVTWRRAFWANAEIRTLAVIMLLTITFHGIVPIRQGLEWYYGKGYGDQLNYVLLAEFLKEEPYSTSEPEIGLRPWLLGPVGFRDPAVQPERSSESGAELIALKKERIGGSIIMAEMSVWSGINGKGGYAATVIFFLTLLAICLYVFLREIGVDRFLAGSGALLAVFLPAITRLSLDGFLAQVSILFAFPFFASLLRQEELSARSFTLFFSLTLAYVVAAYSEIAPIAFCTLLLGVWLVRRDRARSKRLMLMSALLLTALLNPFYLPNLIEFLGRQYYLAAHATTLENLVPNLLTLRGWSELIFGSQTSFPFALVFDCGAIFLGLLFLAGVIFLSRSDRLVFGAVLLPVILVISYLATRTPPASYPIAKIALSILPFALGLVFVAPSRVAAHHHHQSIGVLRKLLGAIVVAAAAGGSVRYYAEVLNDQGLLSYAREPRFLNVCRELEEIKNKRVLIFETHPLLTPWLTYHARHNDVYFDSRLLSDSVFPPPAPFLKVPDLANVDFVATRDKVVDLRIPSLSCLTLVDDTGGEDRRDGQVRYGLGPPARLRFLAFRPISANLKIRLAPGPAAITFPVDFFLADAQGNVSQGQLLGRNIVVRRVTLPRGLTTLQLSVKAEDTDRNADASFPVLAELDGLEISDTDLDPGK